MIVQFWPKSKPMVRVGQGICLGLAILCGLYGIWVYSRVVSGHLQTIQVVQYRGSVGLAPASAAPAVQVPEHAFVASKRGKYYYPSTCSKARGLSSANMLYFKDISAAEAAGFKPFSGC